MTPIETERAAALLAAARSGLHPLEALPEDLRPKTPAEAYGVQEVGARAGGRPRAGYKIGASSRTAQELLGVDEPFAGQVFRDLCLESPAVFSASDYLFRLIEPEFAFRLGEDLPAREDGYDSDRVAGAVASVHPSIELVTSAYGMGWTDVGGLALIADNGAHGALVLGTGTTDWRALDLPSHGVALSVNGEAIGQGQGANALGGPMNALTWLANHLSARDLGLAAGDIVTTGLVTEFAYLDYGDWAVADYGLLGNVEVRFS